MLFFNGDDGRRYRGRIPIDGGDRDLYCTGRMTRNKPVQV
jgi:hypothetical protein